MAAKELVEVCVSVQRPIYLAPRCVSVLEIASKNECKCSRGYYFHWSTTTETHYYRNHRHGIADCGLISAEFGRKNKLIRDYFAEKLIKIQVLQRT